jgi:hypothetical protein
MSTELVERLRAVEAALPDRPYAALTARKAADRIEALEQAVDAFADICDELGCERDNEAGLQAAAALKAKVALLTEALATDRLAVIEECARAADAVAKVIKSNGWPQYAAQQCATAIRALSEPDKDKEGML